ncbi:MAG: penicillin-binding protein beta-lactamase class [Actinomycetia bacterium]|nr:penicillin-binding protein beta-lactamase class [Actinomycetes bacterium]
MVTAPLSAEAVADPAALGFDPEAIAALRERATREINAGLLPSCQLALARDGKVAWSETFGDATSASRYVIFSATKAVVAGAVWLLIGEGNLDPAERVGDIVPEFAANEKETITVEQVMLHTSGFPRAPLGPPTWGDRTHRLEAFSRWRCNWEPGTRYEYHPTSAHWVLAEIIERRTGDDYRAFIRRRILEPLGLRNLQLGRLPGDGPIDNVNQLTRVGEPPSADELEAALGIREMPLTDVTPEALLGFNEPEQREVGVPGGGGVSTAVDLALYYQALLHNTNDMWDPDVLSDVTSRVRNRLPDYLGIEANRALGVVIAGDDGKSHLRGFGHTVSPRAFGHNGAGGQIAWADPETGVSFCYFTNGLDENIIRQTRRTSGIASRAATCVDRG